MVDPNVLISAAISRHGPPREVLEHWFARDFEMIVSYDLLYELEAVLLRDRFREKLTVSDVLEYVRYIADRATMVDQPKPHGRVAGIPDPDDYYLAKLAESADADPWCRATPISAWSSGHPRRASSETSWSGTATPYPPPSRRRFSEVRIQHPAHPARRSREDRRDGDSRWASRRRGPVRRARAAGRSSLPCR